MAKQPWMKFYPADWRSDPALRMCSVAARGLWIEMLCIMHEAEPRGFLTINGIALNPKQLASLTGIPVREIVGLLGELEDAAVFSRADNGAIYSRRILRDEAKAAKDRENGGLGGNPKLKMGVNPPENPNPSRKEKGEDKAHWNMASDFSDSPFPIHGSEDSQEEALGGRVVRLRGGAA